MVSDIIRHNLISNHESVIMNSDHLLVNPNWKIG